MITKNVISEFKKLYKRLGVPDKYARSGPFSLTTNRFAGTKNYSYLKYGRFYEYSMLEGVARKKE